MNVIEFYSITLGREQLRTIAAGLNELPYKVVAPLLNELQRQVDEQDRAAAKAAAEEQTKGEAEAAER